MTSFTLYMVMQRAGLADNAHNKALAIQIFKEDAFYKNHITTSFLSTSIEAESLEEVAEFLKKKVEEKTNAAIEAYETATAIAEFGSVEAKQAHDAELAQIMITSGHDFEGYRITKYSGYISGDDAVEIPRNNVFDKKTNGGNLTDALVRIRRQSLKELKEAAYDLGCNAVIGVDFDYITLEPETISGTTHYYEPYVICVTANGTAVTIEKE